MIVLTVYVEMQTNFNSMTTPKKTTPKKGNQPKTANGDVSHKTTTSKRSISVSIKQVAVATKTRIQGLLVRRPHRSFKRTMRRDYDRQLRLPGYWSFTNYVRRVLARNKKLFLTTTVLYGLLSVTLIGLSSQDAYTTLSDTLRATGNDLFGGQWSAIGKATLLLGAGVSGSFNAPLSSTQQVYAVLIFLFTWLTTVWLLRTLLSGGKPKLRDGIYNSGSPLLSTFIVGIVAVIQLLPVALAAAGVAAAVSSGLLSSGVESMVFWAVVALLALLSLYWITSTFIALIVVTLPGMYPLEAVKIAGDLVIGRRLRILLRLVWLFLVTALAWVVIMVPVIMFDSWIKGIFPTIQNLPIVPVSMLIMSSSTVIWMASYVYLFYRKVVDDDAAPA
jgi:hypothetical protein